jgi:indoleamine 2,3-dioxygenase
MIRTLRAAAAARHMSCRGITTSIPRNLASEASPSVAAKVKPWVNPFPEDQFSVGPQNGFLPKDDPIANLPAEYAEMDSLLDRMRLVKLDGKPGLLATGDFGAACDSELPQYDLSKVTDPALLNGTSQLHPVIGY